MIQINKEINASESFILFAGVNLVFINIYQFYDITIASSVFNPSPKML